MDRYRRPPPRISSSSSSGGFTLIEAIVTVAIIGLLASLSLVGVGQARRNATVRAAAQQVAAHLRETASLAQNRVRAPGCGDAPDCARYTVNFTANAAGYTRAAAGGGAARAHALPAGAVFSSTGGTTFAYDPPLTIATGTRAIPIHHAQNPASAGTVCVSALAVVEVVPAGGACP